MKNYAVAIASIFSGTNTIHIVRAASAEEAIKTALRRAGWNVNDDKPVNETLSEIEDLVSSAHEVTVP